MDFKNLRAGERRKLARNLQENVSARRIGVAGFCLARMFMPIFVLLGLTAAASLIYVNQDQLGLPPEVAFAVVAPLTGKIDVALTNFSKGYSQNELVSDILFPRVGVGKQSDKYWVHGREGQEQTNKTKRAPGAVPEETRFALSTDSYFCDSRALQATIPAETEQNYEAGNLEQDTAQMLTEKILLDKEIEAASLATDTAVVTNNTTLAGGDQWSDYGTSKPGDVVETAIAKIVEAGAKANLMILGDAVFRKLRQHPALINQFKYVQADKLNETHLATYFGIERVIVASAVKRSIAGVASFVWGKVAIVAHVAAAPTQKDSSACKSFIWQNAPGTLGGYGVMVEPHPFKSAKAKIVSADMYYGQKVVNADTLYLIKDAVA